MKMKIMVIGLDCAAPDVVLRDEGLTNIRRLMNRGCYGALESVIPPITVPAWMCMSTSQDPGSLGVYGFRNRTDHSYGGLGVANSTSIVAPAIWDHLGEEGKHVVLVGVPPTYPPPKVNGVCVGCFLTPDPAQSEFTHPAGIKAEIEKLVGTYPVDVTGFRTDNKDWLKDQVYDMTRKHFEVIRHLMTTVDWDYFQFVEIGLDRMHHGFWKYHDRSHRQYEPGSSYESVVRDYYLYLDDEIGRLLALLDEETIVLVASDHGAQRLEGGFCVNEWLRREGLLVLTEEPTQPTPFSPKLVDWTRTKVWSEGGYYARVFVNVEGREPTGLVPAAHYDAFLEDLTARFQALPDDRGRPMGTTVFKPKEIYKKVRNVAPDLIVHFGGLYWRSIGGVGHRDLHVQENDTGPDGCNHAQFGVFVLSAPSLSGRGEVQGMRLLDIAPTLLDLSGSAIPASMQGRSLLKTSPAVTWREGCPGAA
jgi:predicted AlkP superfamily phosphohydrolase/phosphomutase